MQWQLAIRRLVACCCLWASVTLWRITNPGGYTGDIIMRLRASSVHKGIAITPMMQKPGMKQWPPYHTESWWSQTYNCTYFPCMPQNEHRWRSSPILPCSAELQVANYMEETESDNLIWTYSQQTIFKPPQSPIEQAICRGAGGTPLPISRWYWDRYRPSRIRPDGSEPHSTSLSIAEETVAWWDYSSSYYHGVPHHTRFSWGMPAASPVYPGSGPPAQGWKVSSMACACRGGRSTYIYQPCQAY